jgi:hypothetical protein
MKQKDIALIIIIAAISAGLSFGLSQLVFSSAQAGSQKAAVVDAITTDFASPDPKFFNTQSIDPSEIIQVSPSNNPNPFNGPGH